MKVKQDAEEPYINFQPSNPMTIQPYSINEYINFNTNVKEEDLSFQWEGGYGPGIGGIYHNPGKTYNLQIMFSPFSNYKAAEEHSAILFLYKGKELVKFEIIQKGAYFNTGSFNVNPRTLGWNTSGGRITAYAVPELKDDKLKASCSLDGFNYTVSGKEIRYTVPNNESPNERKFTITVSSAYSGGPTANVEITQQGKR